MGDLHQGERWGFYGFIFSFLEDFILELVWVKFFLKYFMDISYGMVYSSWDFYKVVYNLLL